LIRECLPAILTLPQPLIFYPPHSRQSAVQPPP
jgi:hypothetical protein